MNQTRLFLMIVVALFLAPNISAQEPSASPGYAIPNTKVMISAIDEIDLPAREAGVIAELSVQMGVSVTKGQLLALLDDDDVLVRINMAKTDLAMARAEAESEASVKEADALVKIAEAEYENSKEIDKQLDDAVSLFELRRLSATAERSRYRAEVTRVDQIIAELTLAARESQLERIQVEQKRRRVVSPINGVVVRKFRDAGEWVNVGAPVVRLVRMDRLRAEALVDSDEFAPADLLGKTMNLNVRIKKNVVRQVRAIVTFASPEVSSGGRFVIYAEFENPKENGVWVVRPGLSATAEIEIQQAAIEANRR